MGERLTLATTHQLQREVQAVREHLQQLDAGMAAAKLTLRSLEVRLHRAREPAPSKPEESRPRGTDLPGNSGPGHQPC